MRMYVESEQWYGVQPKMHAVYGWMATALAVTAGTAYFVAQSPGIMATIHNPANSWIFFLIVIAQLMLVVALTIMIQTQRISPAAALAGLIAYAVLNGLTLSILFLVYTPASLAGAFITTSFMFAGMALYGYFTETDLSGMGNLLFMALLGLIVGMLVNIFLKSSRFDFFLSGIAVIIFTLLTAYDTQKIKALLAQAPSTYRTQIAVIGALMLYLDFINLLLNLLRLVGTRRQD